MPPAQRATTLGFSARITQGFTYGFPLLLMIGFALYSLILWAAFNFGLGAQTTFWQVYAVSWYAALPYLVTTLLTILTLLFGGNAEAYEYRNPVGTNLAFYLPDAAPALKALLSGFDIIKLWSIALQGHRHGHHLAQINRHLGRHRRRLVRPRARPLRRRGSSLQLAQHHPPCAPSQAQPEHLPSLSPLHPHPSPPTATRPCQAPQPLFQRTTNDPQTTYLPPIAGISTPPASVK